MGYLSPPPMPAPVVVYKDVGGLVTDYQAQTEQYRRENREVRLHECRSACTLALSLPNVCVYPDAKVKFHQAYNANTREIDYGVSDELWTSYPAAVRARLGYLTRDYRILSGSELIALGMRNCNGDSPTMIASRRERAPTRLASARAPAGPNARLGEFGDLAQRVQTAVASAFTETPATSAPVQAPIRVAVADRTPVLAPSALSTSRIIPLPPIRPAFSAGESSVTFASAAGASEPPLPPRRPPSEAFTGADAAAAPIIQATDDVSPQQTQALISGAQPVLGRDFVRNTIRGSVAATAN